MKEVAEFLKESYEQGNFFWHADDSFVASDWVILLGCSRDSETLEISNYEEALRLLAEKGTENTDYEQIEFAHWACGWIKEIFVRKGTECFDLAIQIAEGYPVLNEDDFSDREYKALWDSWENYMKPDFTEYLTLKLGTERKALNYLKKNESEIVSYIQGYWGCDTSHLRKDMIVECVEHVKTESKRARRIA